MTVDARTETIKWLRQWADALGTFGAAARKQADREIVWWMRKAADLLEDDMRMQQRLIDGLRAIPRDPDGTEEDAA